MWGLIFSMLGCRLTDSANPEAFYLEIKEVVVANPVNGNAELNKVTEVWVFIDNQIMGLYPLPAFIPVEYVKDKIDIKLFAGIRRNGFIDYPVFHPFLVTPDITMNVSPNVKYALFPIFEYGTSASMPINESFEVSNSFSIDYDGNPETKMERTNKDASNGQYALLNVFKDGNKISEALSIRPISKTEHKRGKSYIEFDYKGQDEISLGIAKIKDGFFNVKYEVFVPAKPEWNRIYIDVTDILSPHDFDEYRLIIRILKISSSSESETYIDNIRHIHF